jgi:hypothetical protein
VSLPRPDAEDAFRAAVSVGFLVGVLVTATLVRLLFL